MDAPALPPPVDALTVHHQQGCGNEAERDADDPRKGQPRIDVGTREHDDVQRGRHRHRGEHDVLEGAEAEHARPCLTRRDTCALQHRLVEREAAGGEEDAEAGRDHCGGAGEVELGPVLGAGNLAVRDDVSHIRDDLRAEGDRSPPPVHVDEPVVHGDEARPPREPGERAEGEDPRGHDHE